jgi:cell division protein FtsQ
MRPPSARDARSAAPKNRRVAEVRPRVAAPATTSARKPARASSGAARPNRRVGAARPQAVREPARPRSARRSPLALLRALPRPQLGPRARRMLGAGMRLVVALTLAWGMLLAAQQGYAYVTTSARFEAKTVAFEPTPHVSAERLTGLMGLQPGTNILAVDVEATRRRIEADPWVKTASVRRELPDTLHVAVTEHEPAAVLLSGHFYLLSRDGVPFKRVAEGERGDLPIVTGVERELLVKGDPAATKVIRRALDVLAAYHGKTRPRLGEVHIGDGGEALLYTEKTGTLLRLGRGPVEDRLARYDALRAALGERADKLSVVHLDAGGPDGGERVVASFVDGAATDAVLAQSVAKHPEPDPLGELAAAAPAPGKPAKHQGKPVKAKGKAKGGAHKFPSGIPKYE